MQRAIVIQDQKIADLPRMLIDVPLLVTERIQFVKQRSRLRFTQPLDS
jgi:hypothetical protein